MKISNKILIMILGLVLCFSINAEAQRTGVEIWGQTCGNCHVIQPAARYTAQQWETLNTHMLITARLTDAEGEAMLKFLKEGAKKVSAVVPAPNEATSDEAAISLNTANPSPKAKTELTPEQIKAIDAFIRDLEKGKNKKE